MTKLKEPAVTKDTNVTMQQEIEAYDNFYTRERERLAASIRRTARWQVAYGVFAGIVGLAYAWLAFIKDNWFFVLVTVIWFGIGYFSFIDGWKDCHYGKRSDHMR